MNPAHKTLSIRPRIELASHCQYRAAPFPSLKTTSRDHLLEQIPRASEFHVRAESFWGKRATWPSNLSVLEGLFSPLAVPRVAPARTNCVAAHLTHIYIAAEFGFDT